MSDPFTTLLRRIRAEAGDNASNALSFLDRPIEPDEVLNPPNSLVEFPTLRQLLARELLRLESEGRVVFDDVIRQQLREAERTGNFSMHGETMTSPEGTLVTLLALVVRQRAEPSRRHPPCWVMSLFRARGGHSPHDHGLGIDIARYEGLEFQGPTLDTFRGTLILVRNLPEGVFELGLPRVPRETWHDFTRYRRFRIDGEFLFRQDRSTPQFSPRFRRPVPLSTHRPSVVWAGPSEFLQPDLEIRRSPSRRGLERDLAYFDHPGNALQFMQAATESEATIRLIFPDEPNHVHITVDIDGHWTAVLRAGRPARGGGGQRH